MLKLKNIERRRKKERLSIKYSSNGGTGIKITRFGLAKLYLIGFTKEII